MRRAMARWKALSKLHKQGALVRAPSLSLRLASSMYHFRDLAEIWKNMTNTEYTAVEGRGTRSDDNTGIA